MNGWVWVALTLIIVFGGVLLWRGGQLSVKCKAGRQKFELDYHDHEQKKS